MANKAKKQVEKTQVEAPKADGFALVFGTATLICPIWLVVAMMYILVPLLNLNLNSLGYWIIGIAIAMSIVAIVVGIKKWLMVFYLLKPSLLLGCIFVWHLLVFMATRTIIFNIVIGILFAVYAIKRCKLMRLEGDYITEEATRILKKNNNALYFTAMLFLFWTVRTTSIMNSMQSMFGMSYWPTFIVTAIIYLVAVYGIVRLQYVISLNIIYFHFHPQGV